VPSAPSGPSSAEATHEETLRVVRRFLSEHGASEQEIDRAQMADVLDLLAADRLHVPSEVRYSEDELSERTGMPVELARRFWRALGFPDPTPGDKQFTELDIDAIRLLGTMVEVGFADVESFLQLARVVGSSMARIADAELSTALLSMLSPLSSGRSAESAYRYMCLADQTLPALRDLREFVWRRHFQAAVRRAMSLRSRGESTTLPELCVGFADMVGFTMLSQQLSEEELALLVGRFEDVAHDVVTSLGGRVVKMIGDEVMFVTDSVAAAARTGVGLAETYADDKLLSDVRVGLAVGPVLLQDGDYYGPVVNLANRLADIAAPGSVLVTDEFHSALLEEEAPVDRDSRASRDKSGGRRHDQYRTGRGVTVVNEGSAGGFTDRFAFSSLRPRVIKDVGRVQLWSLYHEGADPLRSGRRQLSRWDRLAEVLRELDELRERGEKIVTMRHTTEADGDSTRPAEATGANRSAVTAAEAVVGTRESSGSGGPERRDTEGPEREGSSETGDRPSPQVD
jgi:adenylate cyclase